MGTFTQYGFTSMDVLIYLLAGMAAGAAAGWSLARLRTSGAASRQERELAVLDERAKSLAATAAVREDELASVQEKMGQLTAENARRVALHGELEKKLKEQKDEMLRLQEKFTTEFENVANRILKKNTEEFSQSSQKNMGEILSPLKEKLKEFEKKVEDVHKESLQQHASLREQITGLRGLNEQMSRDAVNLTRALKGESKTQGNWGELQLGIILEKAGLQKDTHYTVQSGHRDEDGSLRKPDFIIRLPENKHLVIDAKVSLTDYERFFSSDDGEKDGHLKRHLGSLRSHIRELGSKNYQHLYQINTPDYVLMYVPVEPAFTIALQHDDKLFDEALARNIVLVTTSTLLATMRTVSYIWKQENLTRNVMEIARQGGSLYDKFVGFLQDMDRIRGGLDTAHNAYAEAVKKLSEGRGNLVSRVDALRRLGAKTSRGQGDIPASFLDAGAEEETAITE